MDLKNYEEIFRFAIEREQEAVAFYQELQEMVRFESQMQLLKEFEMMERSHIEILRNIRRSDLEDIMVPDIPDLKISDYLVEPEPTSEMSYQDLITIAMKREEASFNLYTDMAGQVGDEEVRTLFLKLASEEAKHKLHFEKMYDEDILEEN